MMTYYIRLYEDQTQHDPYCPNTTTIYHHLQLVIETIFRILTLNNEIYKSINIISARFEQGHQTRNN